MTAGASPRRCFRLHPPAIEQQPHCGSLAILRRRHERRPSIGATNIGSMPASRNSRSLSISPYLAASRNSDDIAKQLRSP